MAIPYILIQILNLLNQKEPVLLSQLIENSQVDIFFLVASVLIINFKLLSVV